MGINKENQVMEVEQSKEAIEVSISKKDEAEANCTYKKNEPAKVYIKEAKPITNTLDDFKKDKERIENRQAKK